MNQRTPPFDNLKARQAVNYGIDRDQLVKIRGGLGKTTQNFLPPDVSAVQEDHFYKHNVAKAKQLVQQSGTKGMNVAVYTIGDDEIDKATGEYLQGVLKEIGWNAEHARARGRYVLHGRRKPGDEGADRLHRLVPGLPVPDRLVRRPPGREEDHQTHNNNNSNVDIPAVNKEIERLSTCRPTRRMSKDDERAGPSSTRSSWSSTRARLRS